MEGGGAGKPVGAKSAVGAASKGSGGRLQTWFDVSIARKPAGRITFELFADIAPKTVENFRA
jgi:hypothetical protein